MSKSRTRVMLAAVVVAVAVVTAFAYRAQAATFCNGCYYNYSTTLGIPSDNGNYVLIHYYDSVSGKYLVKLNGHQCFPGPNFASWSTVFDGDIAYCQGGYGSHVNQWGTGNSSNYLVMQNDGNLVLYNGSGTAIWETNTDGYGSSAYLNVQDDGNLVVYYNTNVPIWSIK